MPKPVFPNNIQRPYIRVSRTVRTRHPHCLLEECCNGGLVYDCGGRFPGTAIHDQKDVAISCLLACCCKQWRPGSRCIQSLHKMDGKTSDHSTIKDWDRPRIAQSTPFRCIPGENQCHRPVSNMKETHLPDLTQQVSDDTLAPSENRRAGSCPLEKVVPWFLGVECRGRHSLLQ